MIFHNLNAYKIGVHCTYISQPHTVLKITCSTTQWPCPAAVSIACSATTSCPCPSDTLWKLSLSRVNPSFLPKSSTSYRREILVSTFTHRMCYFFITKMYRGGGQGICRFIPKSVLALCNKNHKTSGKFVSVLYKCPFTYLFLSSRVFKKLQTPLWKMSILHMVTFFASISSILALTNHSLHPPIIHILDFPFLVYLLVHPCLTHSNHIIQYSNIFI